MDAFIGEVRAFPFGYVPQGWLACNGSLYPIQQYPALASILGITYGGDGRSSFAVPNIQGYAVLGAGQSKQGMTYALGKTVGTSTETLTYAQMTNHTHIAQTQATAARVTGPSANALVLSPSYTAGGKTYALPMYATSPSSSVQNQMAPQMLQPAGGGTGGATQPHSNTSPYVIFRYCICQDGTYPDFP